jgi:hypothetical protein
VAITDTIRTACASVARRARHVRIDERAVAAYAGALPPGPPRSGPPPADRAGAERRAAFELTLDAINFGSGWFPTLRKADGFRPCARQPA